MIDYKEQYDLVDKSSWRDGVWKQEPDRVSWVDPETGYHCLVRRSYEAGFLCGYVAIEKDHPFYGKDWKDHDGLEVHGGLTYSNACSGDGITGICHATKDKDEAWWFGFDCGHAWDVMPGIELPKLSPKIESYVQSLQENYGIGLDVYRDLAYCTEEVKSLAKQLKQVEMQAVAMGNGQNCILICADC